MAWSKSFMIAGLLTMVFFPPKISPLDAPPFSDDTNSFLARVCDSLKGILSNNGIKIESVDQFSRCAPYASPNSTRPSIEDARKKVKRSVPAALTYAAEARRSGYESSYDYDSSGYVSEASLTSGYQSQSDVSSFDPSDLIGLFAALAAFALVAFTSFSAATANNATNSVNNGPVSFGNIFNRASSSNDFYIDVIAP